MMTKKTLLKFVIVFVFTLLITTSYFIYILSGGFEIGFQPIHVLRVMKQFGVVVSLPTALVFMGVDYLLCKMTSKKLLLQLFRSITFFTIMYVVGFAFSSYMIVNSFFNNPLQGP